MRNAIEIKVERSVTSVEVIEVQRELYLYAIYQQGDTYGALTIELPRDARYDDAVGVQQWDLSGACWSDVENLDDDKCYQNGVLIAVVDFEKNESSWTVRAPECDLTINAIADFLRWPKMRNACTALVGKSGLCGSDAEARRVCEAYAADCPAYLHDDLDLEPVVAEITA